MFLQQPVRHTCGLFRGRVLAEEIVFSLSFQFTERGSSPVVISFWLPVAL